MPLWTWGKGCCLCVRVASLRRRDWQLGDSRDADAEALAALAQCYCCNANAAKRSQVLKHTLTAKSDFCLTSMLSWFIHDKPQMRKTSLGYRRRAFGLIFLPLFGFGKHAVFVAAALNLHLHSLQPFAGKVFHLQIRAAERSGRWHWNNQSSAFAGKEQ